MTTRELATPATVPLARPARPAVVERSARRSDQVATGGAGR